jgi:hypothetical protein
MREGDKCWAHHPRGGVITGVCSKLYPGLYSKERKVCVDLEAAKAMNGFSVPASQVFAGEPPAAPAKDNK